MGSTARKPLDYRAGSACQNLLPVISNLRPIDPVSTQRKMAATHEHLEYLDGWRGLAILMVLIAHFIGDPGVNLGRFGVDLFFVLSGLLMSRILFERRTPIAMFYRRRISRILPAFLLFVALIVGTFDLTGHPTSAKELVALLTFTRTYVSPSIWHSAAPVGHIWSLNVEEHCYILLALVATITALRVRAGAVLLGLAVACLGAITAHSVLSHESPFFWMINTECAATGLMASAALRTFTRPRCAWLSPVAMGMAFACYIDAVSWWVAAYFAPFALAVSVNYLEYCQPMVKLMSARGLQFLGLISYSVYLWQQPFYAYPFNVRHGILLSLLAALACGAGSFHFFESPIRRWLNSNWGRQPARVAALL